MFFIRKILITHEYVGFYLESYRKFNCMMDFCAKYEN